MTFVSCELGKFSQIAFDSNKKTMKKLLLTFLYGALFSTGVFAQKVHKVVVQMNTSDTTAWHGAIRNISNLQTALGPNTQVEDRKSVV